MQKIKKKKNKLNKKLLKKIIFQEIFLREINKKNLTILVHLTIVKSQDNMLVL